MIAWPEEVVVVHHSHLMVVRHMSLEKSAVQRGLFKQLTLLVLLRRWWSTIAAVLLRWRLLIVLILLRRWLLIRLRWTIAVLLLRMLVVIVLTRKHGDEYRLPN